MLVLSRKRTLENTCFSDVFVKKESESEIRRAFTIIFFISEEFQVIEP